MQSEQKQNPSKNLQLQFTLTDHIEYILSLVLLKDGRIASCSNDLTIKVFNPDTDYHCDLTIKDHQSRVNFIYVLKDGRFVSCCENKAYIWEICKDNYKLLTTFEDDMKRKLYTVLELEDERIIACYFDAFIKVWEKNQNEFKCSISLDGKEDNRVDLFPITNNKLAFCYYNGDIKIGTVKEKFECDKKLKGDFNEELDFGDVYHLMNNKKFLLFAYSKDHFTDNDRRPFIEIWNLEQGSVQIQKLNESCACILEIDDNRVALGGDDAITVINIITNQKEKILVDYSFGSIIHSWNVGKGKMLFANDQGCVFAYNNEFQPIEKKQCHDGSIFALISLNENTIATCSFDKTIKIWKVE